MYSVKSSGNSTSSCNAECPWMALKYRKCLEELGFKQYWNLFFGPPPFARKDIQASIDQAPSNFALSFSARSSNLPDPSSSPWTVSSCRNNLIMNFDTSKQPWLYFPGSTPIHFHSRQGIDTEDNIQVVRGRGLETFSLVLLLLPEKISNRQLAIAPIKLFLEFFHDIVKSYCSIIYSRNWLIMSQLSDHGFWHCKTILTKALRIDVYLFSSTKRNRNGRQCHSRLWSWL